MNYQNYRYKLKKRFPGSCNSQGINVIENNISPSIMRDFGGKVKMDKRLKSGFEEFFAEMMDASAKIEYYSNKGKDELRIEGAAPILFYMVWEIVKQLAMQEEKIGHGPASSYVEMLTGVILKELREEQ